MSWWGCQAPAEEFSAPDWTPIVAVPLVDTRFDLEDVLRALSENGDSLPIEAGEGGRLIFVYDEDFTGTLAEDWLELPDVEEFAALELDAGIASVLNLLGAGENVLLSDTIVTEMIVDAPPGVLIHEVQLSAGQLQFDIESTLGDGMEGQLTIPNLLDPIGMPWSVAWSDAMMVNGAFSVTEDLAGWSIHPENPNVQDTNLVRAFFDVYVINDPAHTAVPGESLAAEFRMDGLLFERVEGDFGSSDISLEEGTSTLSIFDERFTVAGIGIDQATVALEVTNGFGVEAVLDSVELLIVENGVAIQELVTTADPLTVPPAEGSAQNPSVTTWVLDDENSNITDFFGVESQELELRAWVRSNPSAVTPDNPHFVDDDGYVTARLHAEVPLSMKVEQLDFIDTLDIALDLEDEVAELDSAELRIILHNGFPFGVDLAVTFLDSVDQRVDSLSLAPLPLFTMPALDGEGLPLASEVFVHDIAFDWDRAQLLKSARRVIVEVWTASAEAQEGTYVRLTESQELRMELAAKLYARIGL